MRADVRLRNGYRLRGTGKVLCARGGALQDVDVRDLVVGDWVALGFGDDGAFGRDLVQLGWFSLSKPYGSQKPICVPEVLDEDLAMLLGMYASDGHTTMRTWTIVITNSVPAVLQRAVVLWKSCFDIDARVAQYGDSFSSPTRRSPPSVSWTPTPTSTLDEAAPTWCHSCTDRSCMPTFRTDPVAATAQDSRPPRSRSLRRAAGATCCRSRRGLRACQRALRRAQPSCRVRRWRTSDRRSFRSAPCRRIAG